MPPKQNFSRMGSTRRTDSNNNLQLLSNFKLPSGNIPQNNRYADTDSQSDGVSVCLDDDDSPLPSRHSSPSSNNTAALMRTKYNSSPIQNRGVLTMSMSPLNNLNKTPPPGIFIEQKSSAVFSAPKTKNFNTSPTTSPQKDQSSPSLYFLQRQNITPTHHQSQYVKKGLELASEVYQVAPKRTSSKTRLITRRTSMQSSTMTTK